MIKLVSNLDLSSDNGLVCKDRYGKIDSVTHIQGSLDGACAIYSLMMNLLILRCIGHKDTMVYVEHKDNDIRKLFRTLTEKTGMHRNGRSFAWVQRQVRDYFDSMVYCDRKNSKGQNSIDHIKNYLDQDLPVIISVAGKDWAHAMLAVGYECDSDDIPTKIFCLDPSGRYA